MKKELRYAFKRGSIRSLVSSKRELIYLQSMFSSRILIAIHHKEFIVNVDGSSFSRSVKNNNSWLTIKKLMPILKTLCKGRTNILLALSIDGRWFWMILNEVALILLFVFSCSSSKIMLDLCEETLNFQSRLCFITQVFI